MKIRTNYVSNSSSSSFIIHVKDWNKSIPLPNHPVGITPELFTTYLAGLYDSHSDATQVDNYGYQAIVDDFKGWLDVPSDWWDNLDKLNKALGDDLDDSLLDIRINYCDKFSKMLLEELVSAGAIDILWRSDS